MSIKKNRYHILLVAISFVFLGTPIAFPSTVGEIAQALTCTCGCNMLVSACEGTMECGAAEDIKNQIMEKLNSGMSKDEVLSFFVNRYGERILSSPTPRGFNLTAWILPFAAVIFGIGTVYVLLKSWTTRKRPGYEQASFKEEDEVYLEKIEEELRSFES